MKLAKKIILSAVGVLLLAVIIFGIVFCVTYADRFKTMSSIEKMSGYDDGYDLYRMDIKHEYDIDAIINYGIDSDQDFLDAVVGQALPLLPISIKVPSFSCSAFRLTDGDGDVMMGRSYDFRKNTSAMLVYCAPEDGYKSVAFAALDNIKANKATKLKSTLASLTAPFICLDGMNEKGVSIAVLTLDSDPTRQDTDKPNISTTIAIRLVLDRAATTQEAIELLQQYDMLATSGRDYHFYINDATGDARVVEWDCDDESRPLVATPTQTVTNFFILHKDKVTTDKDNGIYGHGKNRYDAIESILNAATQPDKATAWEALHACAQDPSPTDITSNTQWSIVFNNSDRTLEFVLRRNWEDIYRYDLTTNTLQKPE